MENEEIYLRRIEKKDTDNILKWRNNKNVKNYFVQSELTKEEHEWWLKNKIETGEAIQYIIYLKKQQQDIGTVYLRNIDKKNSNAEFGIYIGEIEFRGKGYAKAAMELICNYAFETMNLHKIYLRVLSTNINAINLYKKCGFVESGVFREHIYDVEKNFIDLVFMERIKKNG